MTDRKELIEKWLAENKKTTTRKKRKISKEKVKSSTQQRAQSYKKQNIKKQTKSETKMQLILKKFNFQVEPQKIFYCEKENFYLADFYLPKLKIVIEVDGKYHNKEEQKIKDAYKDHFYTKKKKLKLIRITNEKLSKTSDEQLKNIIFQLSEKELGSSIYLK